MMCGPLRVVVLFRDNCGGGSAVPVAADLQRRRCTSAAGSVSASV